MSVFWWGTPLYCVEIKQRLESIFLAFFLSWVARTQLNHCSKWVVRTQSCWKFVTSNHRQGSDNH